MQVNDRYASHAISGTQAGPRKKGNKNLKAWLDKCVCKEVQAYVSFHNTVNDLIDALSQINAPCIRRPSDIPYDSHSKIYQGLAKWSKIIQVIQFPLWLE